MPIIYVNSIEDEVLPLLKEKGITTYAAHLEGRNDYDKAVSYTHLLWEKLQCFVWHR